jgi:hypothetical protein
MWFCIVEKLKIMVLCSCRDMSKYNSKDMMVYCGANIIHVSHTLVEIMKVSIGRPLPQVQSHLSNVCFGNFLKHFIWRRIYVFPINTQQQMAQ